MPDPTDHRPVPASSAPTPDMTADQLRDLVERFIGEQRRDPSPPLIEEWAGQVALGRWTYAEARRALAQWIAHRPERWRPLEPGDIRELIRSERHDRAMRERTAEARERYAEADTARRAAELPPDERPESDADEPPATPELRAQMIAQFAADCGRDADVLDDPELRETALPVRCRWCKAAVGEFCTVPRTRGPRRRQRLTQRGAHPCRVEDLHALRAAERAGAPS